MLDNIDLKEIKEELNKEIKDFLDVVNKEKDIINNIINIQNERDIRNK